MKKIFLLMLITFFCTCTFATISSAQNNLLNAKEVTQLVKGKTWRVTEVQPDKKTGEAYVFSPCGRCREFMYQINNKNLNTKVILDKNKAVKLKELLPYAGWSKKQ